MKRVVVTGIGTINALGHNVEESFKAVVNGECGIDKITLFDPTNFPVQIAAEVKNFDSSTVMDKKESKKADRFIHLGLKASKEALLDAKLITTSDNKVDPSISNRFGIISASGIGGLPKISKNSVACHTRGAKKVSPFFIPSAASSGISISNFSSKAITNSTTSNESAPKSSMNFDSSFTSPGLQSSCSTTTSLMSSNNAIIFPFIKLFSIISKIF